MKKTISTKKKTSAKKSLMELAEHWKQLERKTAEQRKEAEAYYVGAQKGSFLYTEISERYLAKVVGYCGLDAFRYDKSIIHETEPLDVYREIKSRRET